MAVPETPITRLEKYWAAILDKIQGGGSAPEWGRFIATGTFDAPYTYEDFITLKARASELYIKMDIDATAIGAGMGSALAYYRASASTSGEIHFSGCVIPSMDINSVLASEVVIAFSDVDKSIQLNSALMMQQGTIVDLSQYASLMPTTTTFVYHIPSSND